MRKSLLLPLSILLLSGTLAACGTSDTAEENPETPDTTAEDTAEEAVEEESAEDVPAEETTKEPAEEASEDATEDSGEETTGTTSPEASLTASEQQPYEIHVLPDYQLTAEEPNKDSLYLSEDSSVFMRIETFTSEESDFASAAETMQQTLTAVNEEAEVTELPAFEDPEFSNSSVMEIPSAEGKVTGITFEKDQLIVRATIFDSSSANATEDFIEMAKTIQYTE